MLKPAGNCLASASISFIASPEATPGRGSPWISIADTPL